MLFYNYIHSKLSSCSLHVLLICSSCFLHVLFMFSSCSPHLLFVFPSCFIHVLFMFSSFFLFVFPYVLVMFSSKCSHDRYSTTKTLHVLGSNPSMLQILLNYLKCGLCNVCNVCMFKCSRDPD